MDQKAIAAGSIFLAMCLLLCVFGVWGWTHAVHERGWMSGSGSRAEEITQDNLVETMQGILSWQCDQYQVSDVQELLDTAYAERAGSGTVQTYVMGLGSFTREYDYTSYLQSVQDLIAEGDIKGISLQKTMVLFSVLQANDLRPSVSTGSTIGEQGIMSYVYGLLMFEGSFYGGSSNSGSPYGESSYEGSSCEGSSNGEGSYAGSTWTRSTLINEILSRQTPDGGFAVMGTEGDVDVTAMTLQALAPHYRKVQESGFDPADGGQNRITAEEADRLILAVERAVSFLSEKQLAAGDFENRGTPNAESTAQVIMALCALDRDPWSDEQFIKDGNTLADGLSNYRSKDGGFSHTAGASANDMATSQVFAALSALYRMSQGECFLLDFENYAGAGSIVEQGPKGRGDVRAALLILLLAADCGYLAYLCFQKKFSLKRLCSIALVTAFLAAAVWMVRIQTREEYLGQDTAGYDGENVIIVSLEIRCDTVAGREEYLPADGVILAKTELSVSEGTSAFDLLNEAARAYDIQIEYEGTAAGDEFAYVEGIGYLYQYDFGELSGWVFLVNGDMPDTGCGSYLVGNGDEIVWYYTTELGKDIEGSLTD